MKKIIRIFPYRNNHTPNDELVFAGIKKKGLTADPIFPSMMPDADEAHVSVTFTWDIKEGQRLKRAWEQFLPTKIGGPAFDDPGGEFEPGMYLKKGITITTRGCPKKCWYCYVPKREGDLRTLKINPGHIVQDNNLLASSMKHQLAVYKILREQRRRASFTGGLEAVCLQEWMADEIRTIPIDQIFFAYDRLGQEAELMDAILKLGFLNRDQLRCYVLVGHQNDSPRAALLRLKLAWDMGYLPFAMYYRDEKNEPPTDEWKDLIREWTRPAITKTVATTED